MDERYTIDTPENIEFAYHIAGIGSRFLAAIVDSLLLALLQIAILFIVFVAGQQTDSSMAGNIFIAAWAILSFIFLWGYYILFEMIWNGQTPGKRIIGLRVVREGGRPITFAISAIRNLVRFIDFLPGFYGIGVLTMFVDSRARRLGDLAAGSLVVKEQRGITLESISRHTEPSDHSPRPADAPDTPLIPNLHLVTDADYDLIQEFLRRRGDLELASRQHLGAQLAYGLRARLGLPSSGDAELFLEHIAREYRVSKQNATTSNSSADPR